MPQHGQLRLEPETFLDRMLDDFRAAEGRALVVTHDNPDPDSLASAFGLKKLFETVLRRETVIGYGGMIGRAENRALVSSCRIPTVPLEDLEFRDFSTVALVDSQPETGNNSIPENASLDLVVVRGGARGKQLERKAGANHYDVLGPLLQPIVAAVR